MCASSLFESRFGRASTRTFWAPGRVNLIGEHIDYCGGTVLPMPLRFGTRVEIARRTDPVVRIFSVARNDTIELDARAPRVIRPRGHWANYATGVASLLADIGCTLTGADVLITADIPGSGLSSSASLCVALAMALARSNGHPLEGIALARLCRRVEHEFAGVHCGLMDQAAIVLGTPQAALCFDCAAETGRAVPMVEPRPSILVIDSGKPRTLASSAYNERLRETRRAAAALSVAPERLVSADPELLRRAPLDPVDINRARHVIFEHRRVIEAVRAIEGGDWAHVGTLFDESHESLKRLYEVSCDELDLLVHLTKLHAGVLGARMTGAGFGGAIVALINTDVNTDVDKAQAQEIAARVASQYTQRTGLEARSFVAESVGGAREVS